jgi:hypothetical protein
MSRSIGRFALRLVPAAALAVAVGLAAGCGRGGPRLVPVEGKVFVNDQPVQAGETVKGYVVLHPDQSKGNMTQEHVSATINPDGSFKVVTRDREGAPTGSYKVTVDLAKTNPKDPYDYKALIEGKYLEKDKSGLVFEVVENPEPGRYDIKIPGKAK